MAKLWKKGRGKLGFLQPLLGSWAADAETPAGPVKCTRVFEPVLGGNFVRLTALWEFGPAAEKFIRKGADRDGKPAPVYEEVALFGACEGEPVGFWSFTSDGKRSQGTVADVTDLHPEAVGFEAQMPAGLARTAYWPTRDGGCVFVVESKNAKGWRRFVEHNYRPV
jgi:hypothetical protein